ncbi:hypothetical protein BHU72_10625 [Desulfuribacillus stibiiarsenatis]|uniref:Hemolysin n=1 Tax=Desulfuribacillus stibiiarsenatis TaxID=1390249 RepID=A0A1E5L2H8_9FIRM|nr:hemolysin family protein [Desulfuribacillus stibiiarsenatis]OEH84261.1 hypothetical protein BHU72_10625 [Desulfuribacillus stibiiarsenatis]
MDSIPYDSIILLAALLFFSSYFSASETAITSANKIRLRNQAETSKKAQHSLILTENFDKSLSTILIGNNIVNIAMASIATKLATDLYGGQASTLVVTTLITTIVVLIFGEILPKSLAKQSPEKFLYTISLSLSIISKIFSPLTWIFVKLKTFVSNMVGKNDEPTVTVEEVKALVDICEEEGTFLAKEKELLHNAIEFDDIVVKEILTPRPDVVAVQSITTIEEVKDVFIREKYSRLPVYEDSIDNIIGILSYRDFFAHYVQDPNFDLLECVRKPYFVIASAKISYLLKEFQLNKVHLAIVLDEYGGTAGIVSIEDIIEEIVGEIWDEHDENEMFIEAIEEGTYLLDGRLSIEDFSRLFHIDLPETSSNTISGWISELMGYLPKKGETIQYEHFTMHIEEVRNRRIQKVLVK